MCVTPVCLRDFIHITYDWYEAHIYILYYSTLYYTSHTRIYYTLYKSVHYTSHTRMYYTSDNITTVDLIESQSVRDMERAVVINISQIVLSSYSKYMYTQLFPEQSSIVVEQIQGDCSHRVISTYSE